MIDNYPDDIRNWDHHPNSPFYEEPPETVESLTDKALHGDREEVYYDMFDLHDLTVLAKLLRDFHANQTADAEDSLIEKLDSMLAIQVEKELE